MSAKNYFKDMASTYDHIELVNIIIKESVPEAKTTDGLVNLYEEITGAHGDKIKDGLLGIEALCSELRQQIVKKPERGDKSISGRVNKVSAYIKDILDFQKKNEAASKINVTDAEEKAAIEKQSLEILRTGKPIEYLMNVFHKDYVGGEEYGRLLILSSMCGTCNNTEGLHPGVDGQSGEGKTLAMKAMSYLIPTEYKVTGKISPNSLFYNKVNPGTTVFLDDVGKMDPDFERIIKLSTSFYQQGAENLTVVNSQGVRQKIPACINWWITGVDAGSFDIQILNRSVNIGVDEPNKTKRLEHKDDIFVHQVDDGGTGRPTLNITREVLIARGIIGHLLGESQVNVRIPYLKDGSGKIIINWQDRENARNFPIFLDMIKASASIHRYQRTTIEGSIIATLDDYDNAQRLWKSISTQQVSKFNHRDQVIFQALMDLEAYDNPVDIKALAQKIGKSEKTVYENLHGRKNDGIKGLLERAQGHLIEITQTETQYEVEIEGEDQYERKKKTGSVGRQRTLLKLSEKIDLLKMYSDVVTIDRVKAQELLDKMLKV